MPASAASIPRKPIAEQIVATVAALTSAAVSAQPATAAIRCRRHQAVRRALPWIASIDRSPNGNPKKDDGNERAYPIRQELVDNPAKDFFRDVQVMTFKIQSAISFDYCIGSAPL
jgi:hypothetical protein